MVLKLEDTPSGRHWMIEHEGYGSDYIEKLFGSKTIPTPFNDTADPDMVLREIKRLNPDRDVVIDLFDYISA